MYRIMCDGQKIGDPSNEELILMNPKVDIEVNSAGTFQFTITPKHPYYDKIKRRSSYIEIYQDNVLLIAGQVVEEKMNFRKDKTFFGEGELSYLNDSIQRPSKYQGLTVRQYLSKLLEEHNKQVDDSKKFSIGAVSVTDPNDSLYRFTNYNNTLTEINDDLVNDLGGYLVVRHQDGKRYLDFLSDFSKTCTQNIEFGENLLDYASNIDSSEIATAIIPLGATLEEQKIEGLDQRLDITSVNDGKDYLYSEEAVKNYGWIYKVVTWDDVTKASNLKKKGQQYLNEIQFENMILEVSAIDLHLVDNATEQLTLGDYVRVISKPHGLDKLFLISKLSYDLNNPSNFKVTLGRKEKKSLSTKSAQASESVKKVVDMITPASTILKDAQENATQLITSALGGYIYKTNNELYIMDSENPDTAQKVWRWNINGLGYSSTGINGQYGLAMTMDGQIVADFIRTGQLSTDRLKGTIRAGGDVSIEWDAVSNAPTIPTNTNQLTNGSGFIDSATATKITKDTVTTSYVNALNVTAKSVACENLTGTTISGKNIVGSTISGGQITQFSEDDKSFISMKNGILWGGKSNNSAYGRLDFDMTINKTPASGLRHTNQLMITAPKIYVANSYNPSTVYQGYSGFLGMNAVNWNGSNWEATNQIVIMRFFNGFATLEH